mgnify:CR=1 FL=1
MPVLIISGTQWGDEGKGRVVDNYAEEADAGGRVQAGPNSGHTLVVGDRKFIGNHLPAMVIRPDKWSFNGPFVFQYVWRLIHELKELGTPFSEIAKHFTVDENAPLILPHHIALDKLREAALGKRKVGTTGRGMGPAVEDFYGRRYVPIGACQNEKLFNECLDRGWDEKVRLLNTFPDSLWEAIELDKAYTLDRKRWTEELLDMGKILRGFFGDTRARVQSMLFENKRIIIEGGQGFYLDPIAGGNPFCTSTPTIGSAFPYLMGIDPKQVVAHVGVVKAYTTRVGAGPFPTELLGEDGEQLRERGHEYGATTGRPRRTGWLDIAIPRQSANRSGVTHLAITKLDVLSGVEHVKVSKRHRFKGGGRYVDERETLTARLLAQIEGDLEDALKWQEDITGCRTFEDLPRNAQGYMREMSSHIGKPIAMTSVGPDRSQKIVRNFVWSG